MNHLDQTGQGTTPAIPPLRELGLELASISPFRRLLSLTFPFACCAAYFAFAALGWWPLAVLALVVLSFVTYGSTSHDLVHQNLGLPKTVTDVLLCLMELLTLRSGHAYRAAHLYHHARYPAEDDVEAAAARMSLPRALAEGVIFQYRLWWWAVRHARRERVWIIGEIVTCLALASLSVILTLFTPVFLIYAVLLIMGSWIIPLITSYIPHNPAGKNELFQTRVFRGVVASPIALEHLYHLEHHLFPSVPHHNWPELARRLDPYLEKAGVKPVKIWF